MNSGLLAGLLSLIIFLPTLGALALAFFDRRAEGAMRGLALGTTVITFVLTLFLLPFYDSDIPVIQPIIEDGRVVTDLVYVDGALQRADGDVLEEGTYQRGVAYEWIGNWNIFYRLGYDGISVPLILLTSFISLLAMLASWSITKQIKGYLILFLLLETGMLGTFLALDFFLFYVFWEVMLLPMYFLIGVWGGPRKEYAAIKFFLYTLGGSILILIAILMYYFGSAEALAALGVENPEPIFNLIALSELAERGLFSQTVQIVAFWLLFVGFAIKVPTVPFHTWLPDAHVEAPTPISMILAGVLLKMGGYGLLRIAFPLCPYGAHYAAYALVAIGAISIIYGAFAAMAQTDFKRLVAYSSVSHMGYVIIGIAVWELNRYGGLDYWQMGINGAMFQMIAHGVSSAGMFFLVGVVYDRVHHRNLNEFGGLAGRMPVYTGLSVGIFFAALGLPGLCGFIGEVFVVLSSWNFSPILAIIAVSGVILTAGYILWTLQRVFLGPEYRGPHPEALTPMNGREIAIAGVLLAAAIVLGVYPRVMFDMMNETTGLLVQSLQNGYRAAIDTASTALVR